MAVGGNLVNFADVFACPLSLVYKPGAPYTGQVECKPHRAGTASNYWVRSSNATFTTRMTVTVVTLHGEMKGTNRMEYNCCGDEGTKTRKLSVVD